MIFKKSEHMMPDGITSHAFKEYYCVTCDVDLQYYPWEKYVTSGRGFWFGFKTWLKQDVWWFISKPLGHSDGKGGFIWSYWWNRWWKWRNLK